MSTRMDKYISETESGSRSARNKKLYEELYNTGTYTNSVVIDQSKEIDISKIKEIIDKEKNANEKKNRPDINFDNVTKKEIEQKVYDINEVLKNAKEKRDIIEEASEKRKNSKYENHLDLEEELSKTRKVYDKILQEETELLDIMNTLANAQADSNIDTSASYKDITSDSIKQKTATVQKVELPGETIEKIDDDGKETTEYSTNTFMFSKKDFDDGELEDSIKESNTFIKILIALLIIAIILGAYYIVTTYILK